MSTSREAREQTQTPMTVASIASGLLDHKTGGLEHIGNGTLSRGLAVGSGLLTAMTHDPATDGALGMVERGLVGLADGAWAFGGGPAAIMDAATGGNVSGGAKSAASAIPVLADMMRGDYKSAEKYTDKLKKGDYGRIAKTAAHAGEWWGDQAHDAFADDYLLTLDAKPVVRDGQRELRKQGLMK